MMGLTASDTGGGDFDLIEPGVYVAVCYCVVDLGTQHNARYDSWQHKVLIGWEIPDERIIVDQESGDTKPRVISRMFTLSLSERSLLRPFLESWRGQPFTASERFSFDISKLLGVNCQLNIIHNTVDNKTYANVAGIMPLTKGIQKRTSENEHIYYSMEDHNLNIPESVYDWQKKIIMESKEYNETGQQPSWGDQDFGPEPEDEDDTIPF